MNTPPPRQPPRFVPTLTDVVHVPHAVPLAVQPGTTSALPGPRADLSSAAAPAPAGAGSVHVAAAPAASNGLHGQARSAPVVQTSALPPNGRPLPSAATAAATPVLPSAALLEEHLVHQVLQRIDVRLGPRLERVIADVVREQTRQLLPRLREELATVVQRVVNEAVAEELARPMSTPPRGSGR